METPMQLQTWEVTKALFAMAKRQQDLINFLFKSHCELGAALAKQFGWEPPQPPPEPTAEEVEKLERGLKELERMFGDGDGK